MPISFDNIPENAFNCICSFIEDKFLLRLREVSKSVKKTVDAAPIVTSCKTTLNKLFIIERDTNLIQINCLFQSPRDYSLWKILFTSIKDLLETTRIEFQGYKFEYYTVVILLTIDEMDAFLANMKRIIQRVRFVDTFIWNTNSSTVRMSAEFLADISMRNVYFSQGSLERDDYLARCEFVSKVRAKHVRFSLSHLLEESVEHLLLLAETVKSLAIVVERESFIEATINVVSLIRNILRRKCDKLHFHQERGNHISTADSEQLLQFIHSLDKKVAFFAWTKEAETNSQIGVYNLIATGDNATRHLSIKHRDK